MQCNPMAFLVEQAGGSQGPLHTYSFGCIMDIQPTVLHQRTPYFVGPTRMVAGRESSCGALRPRSGPTRAKPGHVSSREPSYSLFYYWFIAAFREGRLIFRKVFESLNPYAMRLSL